MAVFCVQDSISKDLIAEKMQSEKQLKQQRGTAGPHSKI